MILVFSIISTIIIIALIACAIVAERKGKIGKLLQKLLSIGALGIMFHLIFIQSSDQTVASIMFALYSGSVDFMLIFMLRIAAEYAEMSDRTLYAHIALIILGLADGFNLLINQLTGHAYTLGRVPVYGNEKVYEVVWTGIGYNAHLFLCYVLVIMVFGVYIHGMLKSSAAYRIKYTGVMAVFSIMLLVDGIWVTLRTSLNIGVLLYGLLGLVMYYLAIVYSPNTLLEFLRKEVMEKMDNGIICLDEKGKMVFSNGSLWKLVNCSPNDENVEKYFKAYFDSKKNRQKEISHWNEEYIIDGEKRYFEVENKNFFDKKDRFMGCYFSVHDITERQIGFEKQISSAQKANQMKSDFLSKTSHEIRTPVNAINGMNEMILREAKDEKILEYAGYIKESTSILIDLINDVLDFSKIESGKFEIRNRTYEPDKLLGDIHRIMENSAMEKKLDFVMNVDDSIPAKLYGDDVRINQIITNLVSNAIKYTDEGFVRIETSWVKNGLQIEVKDSGIGIKEENIPRLFDVYERIENGKIHGIQGTGLGLNITARLVQMMDGHIHVVSELGKGSSFIVFIPQMAKTHKSIGEQREESISASEKTKKAYEPEFVNNNAKILIVDDNALNRRVFCNLLKKSGAQITEADSGQKCLDLVAKEKYNVIFLDHMMPEMDGIETFEIFKKMENNPNIDTPVIMLTANVAVGAREQYVAMGFTDFLSKPIDTHVMEDMLCKYVGVCRIKTMD